MTVFQPCMWFMKEPSQFSVGKTAQRKTYPITEKPHSGLDDCLNMLLACLRQRMSVSPFPKLSRLEAVQADKWEASRTKEERKNG